MKLMVLLLAAAMPHFAQGPAFGLMSGCWAMRTGPVVIQEQWNAPAGGQMMGISRTIRDGKVVFNEFMRIETRADGVYYTPRIGTNAAPVDFKLAKQSPTEVVFENPAHDFPQRILYRKSAEGLFARIEGTKDGKSRSEDFPMQPAPCGK